MNFIIVDSQNQVINIFLKISILKQVFANFMGNSNIDSALIATIIIKDINVRG
jgi:hypothetical protein